jgi:DNA polymerase-3 subunit alpha
MSFVPLQVLSSYSLLASPIKINELVTTAKERGYQAIALTDNNTMYGAVEFYQSCLQNQLKPLVGLTIWLDSSTGIDNQFALILLAKNTTGYHHLMQISSLKMTNSNQPFNFDAIQALLEDLIVIVPPMRSEMSELLERGMANQANELLEQYQQFTDAGALFLGINLKQTNIMRQTLLQMVNKQGIGALPLPNVEYLDSEDHFATQVLRDIGSAEVINHPELLAKTSGNNWLKPRETFEQEFLAEGYQDLLQQLDQVVDLIDMEIPFAKPQLPRFETPNHQSSEQYLNELCQKQLAQIDDPKQRYQERMQRELDVIQTMGFADYFLIIHDVIQFAHQNQVLTGPGRGSAAGSLVAYLLGITSVDPIQYGLLFERFLNPERAQMPDIDLDIPDDKREFILEYVHGKYGHQHVGQIITFGTLAAKQAIRDVARVFGEMPNKINQISALIPSELNITLERALASSSQLQAFIRDSERNRFMFDTARRLEGLPRHFSTHAAGIVLSQQDLTETTPVQNGNDEMLMSQYSKNYVERVGLLKMDFLGLRNLSLMANILQEVHQTQPDFEIEKIDLNDSKTLELFQRGDTSGVFQFESAGIRNVLRKVKPTSFGLVVAVNALYRPGPMENIDRFVKRKEHQEPYSFPNEVLERILGETYGILVYQEQVMEVASAMGGLSLGQADLLRRAMSKKKHDVIEQMRTDFVKGAMAKGYSNKLAMQVYSYIENFANYGFNKSHSVAYSKLAFQLAYLKTYFPGPFYTALLNSVIGGDAKTKEYIQELNHLGIKVQAPDINLSQMQYSYYQGRILMGFLSIRGLRRDFIKNLIQERQTNGAFQSVDALLRRMGDQGINEEIIEKLIYSGALDSFGHNRAEMAEFLPELLKGIAFSGQNVDLFEKLMPKIRHRPDLSLDEKLDYEEELLGTYVSAHPVERYTQLIEQQHMTSISDFKDGETLTTIIYVRNIRVIRTKKGESMAFVKISDQTDECEAVIFPRLYQSTKLLQNKRVLQFRGKVEKRNDELQLIVNEISAPKSIKTEKQNLVWMLKVPSRKNSPEFQTELFSIFKKYHGKIPVVLVYEDTNEKNQLSEKFSLQDSFELKERLAEFLGSGQISLIQK